MRASVIEGAAWQILDLLQSNDTDNHAALQNAACSELDTETEEREKIVKNAPAWIQIARQNPTTCCHATSGHQAAKPHRLGPI